MLHKFLLNLNQTEYVFGATADPVRVGLRVRAKEGNTYREGRVCVVGTFRDGGEWVLYVTPDLELHSALANWCEVLREDVK